MFQVQSITPLRVEEIPELSEFLTTGFGTSPDAPFATPEVLRWKYFDPCGAPEQPRSFIARHEGRIVGHVGLCPRAFVPLGPGSASETAVRTVHFVDWLASRAHPATGLLLMKRGFRCAETQYALGGSADGQQMAERVGYASVANVPMYGKILRPAHRLRDTQHGVMGRFLRVVKDLGRTLAQQRLPSRIRYEAVRVERFGEEVEAVLARFPRRIWTTTRSHDLLNHYLRFPRGTFSGWTLHADGALVGFGVVSIVPEGAARNGKIIECFVDREDSEHWRAAVEALTRELRRQSADYATGFASTPWLREAFASGGFSPLHASVFQLRDAQHRIPREGPFHLSFLEADHGYL